MTLRKDDGSLERLELKISYFLRYGVFASAFFLAISYLGQIFSKDDRLSKFKVYEPVPLVTTIRSALEAQDYFLLSAIVGLSVLISLPIIRVLLTGLLFLKAKEWAMASCAILVFAVLLLSFFLGIEL